MFVVDIFKELKRLSHMEEKTIKIERRNDISFHIRMFDGDTHLIIALITGETYYFRYFKDKFFRIDKGLKILSRIDIDILNLEDEIEIVLSYGRTILDNYYDSRITDNKSDILHFLRNLR